MRTPQPKGITGDFPYNGGMDWASFGVGLLVGFMAAGFGWLALSAVAACARSEAEQQYLVKRLEHIMREALQNLKIRVVWFKDGREVEEEKDAEVDDISDADWWKQDRDR